MFWMEEERLVQLRSGAGAEPFGRNSIDAI
jgi:hypothetical protein